MAHFNFSLYPYYPGHCRFAQTYYNVRQMPGNFKPMVANRLPTLILLSPVCSYVTGSLQMYKCTNLQTKVQMYHAIQMLVKLVIKVDCTKPYEES